MTIVKTVGSHEYRTRHSNGDTIDATDRFAPNGPIVDKAAATTVPTTGSTIDPTGYGKLTVNPAGAITGVILTPGVYDGQRVTIMNVAAAVNTVTFAAAATSNVADGVSSVIAGLIGATFEWDATAARWFHCK